MKISGISECLRYFGCGRNLPELRVPTTGRAFNALRGSKRPSLWRADCPMTLRHQLARLWRTTFLLPRKFLPLGAPHPKECAARFPCLGQTDRRDL